jgi:hypothetical protein
MNGTWSPIEVELLTSRAPTGFTFIVELRGEQLDSDVECILARVRNEQLFELREGVTDIAGGEEGVLA